MEKRQKREGGGGRNIPSIFISTELLGEKTRKLREGNKGGGRLRCIFTSFFPFPLPLFPSFSP